MATGRVIVVGAGLAGLSAALELKRLGFEVDVFERSRLLGGKATSFALDGVEVDNGQHVFLACCTEFIDFVRQIEAAAARARSGRDGRHPGGPEAPLGDAPTEAGEGQGTGATRGVPGLLFLQDRFEALLLARGKQPARLRASSLPAPWHLAGALLRYQHLPPLARLQIGRALLAARKPTRRGETFAAWLDRHGQSRAARNAFWDPFMVPALNAPLEAVSADAALFTIATAFLSDAGAARFGYARVPLARIADDAALTVDRVHLRTPVMGLDVTEYTGEPVVRGIVLEDGTRVPCDSVVLAVPPARLKRILREPEAFGVFGLDGFQLAPIVDVHLWYDKGDEDNRVLDLAFSRRTGRERRRSDLRSPVERHEGELEDGGTRFAALLDSPVQWVFEKVPGYLCCSMSAADDYVSRPGSELVELCRHELEAVLPGLAGIPLLRGSATRDREATFVPSPGLTRSGQATICPQLFLAGAWTDTGWPATMESAVRSGRSAARLLADQHHLF